MTVQIHNGKVLIVDGKVANSAACCGDCICDPNYTSYSLAFVYSSLPDEFVTVTGSLQSGLFEGTMVDTSVVELEWDTGLEEWKVTAEGVTSNDGIPSTDRCDPDGVYANDSVDWVVSVGGGLGDAPCCP